MSGLVIKNIERHCFNHEQDLAEPKQRLLQSSPTEMNERIFSCTLDAVFSPLKNHTEAISDSPGIVKRINLCNSRMCDNVLVVLQFLSLSKLVVELRYSNICRSCW